MLIRDEVFQSVEHVHDFTFDAKVARVFDDMVERSVPFYREVQRMAVELAFEFLQGHCHEDEAYYDLGCSTGNTMVALANLLGASSPVRLIGLEPAEAMRAQAYRKFDTLQVPNRMEIMPCRAEDVDELPGARVITMLYTLQFVRPMNRLKILKMCQRSLRPGGCLILAEKILAEDRELRRVYIDLYHRFKHRSGYGAMEISRKREALENVLIPFTGAENVGLLKEAGFGIVEPVFQWYNFAAYVAVRS